VIRRPLLTVASVAGPVALCCVDTIVRHVLPLVLTDVDQPPTSDDTLGCGEPQAKREN
jgi:hypothetical protein